MRIFGGRPLGQADVDVLALDGCPCELGLLQTGLGLDQHHGGGELVVWGDG